MRTSVFFVLIICCIGYTMSTLPGFKIRLTRKGLDYANEVAHTILAEELKTLKIPDQSGDDHHLQWSLTGIQNRGCTIPSSVMAFVPGQNGITWAMDNLGIDLHADWRVKYKKGWFKISTEGSIDANIRRVSVRITVHLAARPDGRPALSVAGCSASIGDVSVHFHGGSAFILNLFDSVINRKIRSMMQDQICKVIQKEINVNANQKLSQIKVNVEIDNRFLLNYSLVSSPQVHVNDLETQHKGEVFWKGDGKEAPLAPKPLPTLTDESRMMYLWVTDYIANSFTYVAQLHDFLKYNLTDKDFPASQKDYLNTTCRSYCVGKFIPQIAKMYPDAKVEARVQSLSTPHLTIVPQGMTVDLKVDTDLYARTKDKQTHFLVTLRIKLSVSIEGAVINEKLTGKITGHSINVIVVKSAVGTISQAALNFILKGAMDIAIIPELNSIMKKGVDLPVTGSVSFQNTQLILLDGAALIATDLKYTKKAGTASSSSSPQSSSSLRVVSELSLD